VKARFEWGEWCRGAGIVSKALQIVFNEKRGA